MMKSIGGSFTHALSEINDWLKELQASPELPLDALIEIEKAHEIFLPNATKSPEVAMQAHRYGLLMVAYLTYLDKDVLAFYDRRLHVRRQAEAGKASGEKRRKGEWQKHAVALAITAREDKPTLSQDGVAWTIHDRWQSSTTEVRCPSHPTLKKFVSDLEAEGKLPRRATTRKS